MVKKTTRSKSRITYTSYDKAYEEGFEDMPRRVPDITRVSKAVGYKPKRTIDDILADVIDYHRVNNVV